MKAAIIGTGRAQGRWGSDPENPRLMGVGFLHAQTYLSSGVEIVAAADLSAQNRAAFQGKHPSANVYDDFREMLEAERPEIVSICAYVGSRLEMVEAAIRSGTQAIWAEKPLCMTASDGRAILAACDETGVRMVVNHYRRYLHTFVLARQLISEHAIGRPVEVYSCLTNYDLMEMGSHWFDLFRYLLGDPAVEWVLGHAECSGKRELYGHVMEEIGLAFVRFVDGADGILLVGPDANGASGAIRLVGTAGTLDITPEGLRLVTGAGERHLRTMTDLDDPRPGYETDVFAPVLEALMAWADGGSEPEVSVRNAFTSSELYLAAYESALRSAKITLPVDAQDEFPLDALARRGDE
jgi:UDP-N-acetylglucosamine 3-dehydrogenase